MSKRTNRTPKKKVTTRKSKAATRVNPNRWKKVFIKTLRESGNIRDACEQAGVARSTVYEHRKADVVFETEMSLALEDFGDLLEREATRRAVEGWEEPVFGKGEGVGAGTVQVGAIRRYSDTLLIFKMKGALPQKYKDRVEATGPNGGPIVTAVREVIVELPGTTDEAADGIEHRV